MQETSQRKNQTAGYTALPATIHQCPQGHADKGKLSDQEKITVTLILRRRTDGEPPKDVDYFHATPMAERKPVSRSEFAALHGALPEEINKVITFARNHQLEVIGSSPSRRSVVVQGAAAQINSAFKVELHQFESPRGTYHSHDGAAQIPNEIADCVELVVGLDNRPVPAKHFTGDPANTVSLTPQQVAKLYNFPSGDGSGQTIGIYEMVTSDGPPGYAPADIQATLKSFGGGLSMPSISDVSVDGQNNSGQSDGETLLDITVCAAIVQKARLAVYFIGSTNQDIIHGLQQMIHPSTGDPAPNIISISYGWSADELTDSISAAEYGQMSSLFQDAAHLGITVLVSSGDSGVFDQSATLAEASYPATDPWVIACGGTTIGDITGSAFTEYVWNDTWDDNQGKGATGGGISGRFPVPAYQNNLALPTSLNNANFKGRGIPDLAGNASPDSGYPQTIGGQQGVEGGTSAVSPLYAGLFALINQDLGSPVGFVNAQIYALAESSFRDVSGPPGPANNSFNKIAGYPASKGWNACTGLGSVNGAALLQGLKQTASMSPQEMVSAQGVTT